MSEPWEADDGIRTCDHCEKQTEEICSIPGYDDKVCPECLIKWSREQKEEK